MRTISTKIESKNINVDITINSCLPFMTMGLDYNPLVSIENKISQSIDARLLDASIPPANVLDSNEFTFVAHVQSMITKDYMTFYTYTTDDRTILVAIPSLAGWFSTDPANDSMLDGYTICVDGYILGSISRPFNNTDSGLTVIHSEHNEQHVSSVTVAANVLEEYLIPFRGIEGGGTFNNFGYSLPGTTYLESATNSPVQFINLGDTTTVFGTDVSMSRVVKTGPQANEIIPVGTTGATHVLVPVLF